MPLVALGGGAVLGLVFHVGSPMQMLRMNAAEAAIVAAMGGLMFRRGGLAHGPARTWPVSYREATVRRGASRKRPIRTGYAFIA